MSDIGSHWRIDRPSGLFLPEATPQPLSVRTYVPAHYEPNYPYPLLVLFHPNGSNEEQALRLMPRISDRNFLGLSIRGPHLLGVREDGELACGWGPDDTLKDLITDQVLKAVEHTRRNWHVHSERVYLVGFCEGAGAAYHSAFTLADQIGGLAALNGSIPRPSRGQPLFRLDRVRRLRTLIGHGIANAVIPCSNAARDYRLLYTAGAHVKFQTYATTHRIHESMLRDLNRWVIGHINAETDRLVRATAK